MFVVDQGLHGFSDPAFEETIVALWPLLPP
jgi:hypothetical protein